MKLKTLIFTVVVITLAFASVSFAQDTTSSSYDTVAATSKPLAGYDGGFFIQSQDGKYKLNLGARLDTTFYWLSNNTPDNAATATIREDDDQLTFRIRRAAIALIPAFGDHLEFTFSLTAGTGDVATGSGVDGGFNTTYFANGLYTQSKYFDVTFGMFDPEYDLQNFFSTKKYTMVDYPLIMTQQDGEKPVWEDPANNTLTIARPSMGLPTQLGISIGGHLVDKKFRWAASIGNGSETTDNINRNKRFTYTARVQYAILGDEAPYGAMNDYNYSATPQLGIGVAGAFEADKALDATGAAMYNWSLDGTGDLALRWSGFALNIGGYYRQLKTGPAAVIEAGEKYLTDIGYLADASMFVIPKKLEVQAWGCQIIREGPDNDAYEYGGGLNYYFAGPNAKFGVDYSRVLDYDSFTGTSNGKTNRIRTKMQLYF